MTYKTYVKIVWLALILSFGTSIYFYNEMKALEKIVLSNTSIEANELEAIIDEVQIYEATGEIVDVKNNESKVLDKLIKNIFIEDNESKVQDFNNTQKGLIK